MARLRQTHVWIFAGLVVAGSLLFRSSPLSGQSSEERTQFCERSYLIESVRFLERSDLTEPEYNRYVSTTQNLLSRCRTSLRQLGFSARHLEHVEQKFRIRIFAEEEQKFLEQRSLLTASELVELGKLANQRPDRLTRKYQDFLREKKQECTPVDLRSKLPPVRDQDSIGWCYAYAAADLASFETGKEISAVGMAIGLNETKRVQPLTFFGIEYGQEPTEEADLPESQLQGGEMDSAILAANETGYCLESEVPSDDFAFSDLKLALEDVESLVERSHSSPIENLPRSPTRIMNSQTARIPPLSPESERLCEPPSGHALTPGLDIFEFDQILQESDSRNVVRNLIKRSCKNPLKLQLDPKTSTENLAQKTHDLLDNGQVLSFYYDANVLRKREISDQATHGSLIVGRRWNNTSQACELLIRNSWGTTCAPYAYPCEEGNIWIPDNIVMNATLGITYVEK